MLFLIAKIFFFLLAASLVGALAGWILRSFGVSDRLDTIEKTWHRQLENTEAEKNALAADYAQLSRDLKKITNDHAACAPHIAELGAALEELRQEKSSEEEGLSALKQSLAETESLLEETTAKLTQTREERQSTDRQNETLGKKVATLERALEQSERRAADLSTQSADKGHEPATPRLQDRIDELEARLRDRDREIDRLAAGSAAVDTGQSPSPEKKKRRKKRGDKERRAASAPLADGARGPVPNGAEEGRPAGLLASPEGKKDDLKKISGIGKVLERTLNNLGIFHFRQVAALSEKEIAWVATSLGTFPDRIQRDDWVGQAKKLDGGR